ncbi:MAG: TonB-dependent receptor, partial [Gemmatimonadetes bacterium]|nr:TonB-dependent receptor [Gemmatimonadota bacterium]
RNPGSLPLDRIENEERGAWGFNVISGSRKDVRQGQIGATWNGPVGDNRVELATWGIRRELDNPIPGNVIDLNRNAGGVRGSYDGSVEMRTGAFGWRFGAEAEIQDDDRKNFDNDGGDAGALSLDQAERVRAFGFFGQGRLEFSESIAILAGARYDAVRFSVADRFTSGSDPDDSGQRSMSSVNPSIGIVFKPGDRAEIFASASRAFETPTTTELANQASGAGGFNPFLDPQTSVTLEAGFRFAPAPDFSMEASVFLTDVTSQLVPFEVASDPGRTFYRNAGRSEYGGLEVSMDGEIFTDATLRFAYTRTRAEYVSFRPEGAIYSGNRIPGIAPRSVDGVFAYSPGMAFFEVRGLWRQPIPVDDADTTRAPPFFVLDLTAGLDGYSLGETRASPFVRIDNVTDSYYIASVVPNAFGGRYFEPGPGRTFSVGLALTWGY